ncbi:MAG: hypothetical protein R3F59_12720 [Myxococcota bacterium]
MDDQNPQPEKPETDEARPLTREEMEKIVGGVLEIGGGGGGIPRPTPIPRQNCTTNPIP